MAIVAVPYAYFLAAATVRGRMRWIWILVVIFVASGTATFLVQKAWWDSDDIPSLRDAIENDQGFEGTDEYDPVGDDHTNLPEKAPRVQILPAEESEAIPPWESAGGASPMEIPLDRWTAEEKEFRVTSFISLRVELRVLDYPAWRVTVNGQTVRPEHTETTARMVLLLPSGWQHVRVSFVRTPDRKVGIAISVIAVLTLLALLNAGGMRLLSASP